MRGYYGDARAGNRLRRARIAKGFASAPAAASAFGWSLATYIAHEAGSRSWSGDQLQAYATALDVPEEWLAAGRYPAGKAGLDRLRIIAEAPVPEILERLAQLDSGQAYVPQWQRLRMARAAKGFSSASRAAAFFGWKSSTFAAHESGQNRLTAAAAQRYGAAFQVSPQWLLDGSQPSGLPETKDHPTASPPRGSFAEMEHARFSKEWQPKSHGQPTVTIPHLSDVPGRRASIVGNWGVSSSVIPEALMSADLFALTITEEFELGVDLRPNDVVLVLPNLLFVRAIAYLSLDGGDLQVHLSESKCDEDGFVGSIIAIIWRADAS